MQQLHYESQKRSKKCNKTPRAAGNPQSPALCIKFLGGWRMLRAFNSYENPGHQANCQELESIWNPVLNSTTQSEKISFRNIQGHNLLEKIVECLVGMGHQDNLLIREIVKEQIHHLTRKRILWQKSWQKSKHYDSTSFQVSLSDHQSLSESIRINQNQSALMFHHVSIYFSPFYFPRSSILPGLHGGVRLPRARWTHHHRQPGIHARADRLHLHRRETDGILPGPRPLGRSWITEAPEKRIIVDQVQLGGYKILKYLESCQGHLNELRHLRYSVDDSSLSHVERCVARSFSSSWHWHLKHRRLPSGCHGTSWCHEIDEKSMKCRGPDLHSGYGPMFGRL